MTRMSMTADGTRYEDDVEPRLLLVHCLRDHLGLTGTPVGCATSNCGACTVELDGESVESCSVRSLPLRRLPEHRARRPGGSRRGALPGPRNPARGHRAPGRATTRGHAGPGPAGGMDMTGPAATEQPRPAVGRSRPRKEGTRPASGLSATPEYREHLARVPTRRAVPAAAGTE
ncbi:2Fe-2S iron-sulfur cluster-binding protein [Streptomyces sp. NPDC001880]